MGEWNIDREYQNLLAQAMTSGEIVVRTNLPDKRSAPRFDTGQHRVAIQIQPQFRLIDLSATGVAFFSEQHFRPGDSLHIVLRNMMALQARVVECVLVETDAALLEMHYRVQCRFDSPASGKHLLVLLKELERTGTLAALPGANRNGA